MACQIDDLESAALEARQELAERRSTFPNICSNIYMKTLKCDIKTSMTFKVDTGSKSSSIAEYSNHELIENLGLFKKRSLSYEKLDNLEEHLTQVTKALNIISKNKPQKMASGDQCFN